MTGRETDKSDGRVSERGTASLDEMSPELRSRIVDCLEQSLQLDSATQARLQSARRRALTASPIEQGDSSKRGGLGGVFGVRSAGLAFALLLGLSTVFLLQSNPLELEQEIVASVPTVDVSAGVLASAGLEYTQDSLADDQLDLLANESIDLEFYASLDFYLWLESQEA